MADSRRHQSVLTHNTLFHSAHIELPFRPKVRDAILGL
jgi:hypothetical protein